MHISSCISITPRSSCLAQVRAAAKLLSRHARSPQGPISRWNDRAEDSEPEDSFEAPPDSEAAAQAHINALAGACLALGIKYAGTADARACDMLHSYVLYFLCSKQAAPDPVSGGPQLLWMHDGPQAWQRVHAKQSGMLCNAA